MNLEENNRERSNVVSEINLEIEKFKILFGKLGFFNKQHFVVPLSLNNQFK